MPYLQKNFIHNSGGEVLQVIASKEQAMHSSGSRTDNRHFKLKWGEGRARPEYSIIFGDLSPEVNESAIVSLFQARLTSCKSEKIITDATTAQSRGYEGVSNEGNQQGALLEMQGVYCGVPVRA
ncbi:hypothetical protein VMCG_07802 [Cytospora schulzeri]|uniref:RRM domain-containing protein n=1 Tax=Cytospora schulzeri TaxID=448051 RepID=A0A423VZM7_9PEZI|nr:hypothetical protein VMCG_07802 [Valsa malicola]